MNTARRQNSRCFDRINGILPVLLASMLWAIGYFFRKTILQDLSAVLLTFATAAVAALGLWAWSRMPLRTLWSAFVCKPRLYLLLAIFGVVLGTPLMLLGLDRLDIGVALLLEKLQPVFTIVMARLILSERLPPKRIPYAVLAVLSSYVVAVPDPFALSLDPSEFVGVFCVLAAAFCWACATIVGKLIMAIEQDATKVTIIRFILGSLLLLPFGFLSESLGLRFEAGLYVLLVVVLCALFCTALGYVLYYKGLGNLSAGAAAFLEMLTPVTGLILGLVFLGETLSLSQALAIPVLLLSVYCLTVTTPKNPSAYSFAVKTPDR